MPKQSWKMEWLLWLVASVHIFVCPFTKVEESFNIQAMHDIIYHGVNLTKYDHFDFPGVVPRTFLGPLLVVSLSYPFLFFVTFFNLSKFIMQYVVRAVLSTLVLFAFRKFRQGIEKQFGYAVSIWLLLISATQFHFMFYLSRPLPNIFALMLVLVALHYWLNLNHRMFIFISAAVVIIFRAELSILLGLIALKEMIARRLSLISLLSFGVPAVICMLGITIVIDSFFWNRFVWPEGEVLWFNTYLNKSSEWGTSPWSWYFYSALPRALLFTILLIPFGIWLDRRILGLLFPALGYITLYSFLPHKELRFIIYTIPLLNVAAARVCAHVWRNKTKSCWHLALLHVVCFHMLLNLCATAIMLHLSHHNYPGGTAFAKFHELVPRDNEVTVHFDTYSAQTGITRFLEMNPHWKYNKSENLQPEGIEMMEFSHLIAEWPQSVPVSPPPYVSTHSVIGIIPAFSHWKINLSSFPPLHTYVVPRILILKRESPYASLIVNTPKIKSVKI